VLWRLNVAAAIADALVKDDAEDWLDDAGGGDDDKSPIESRDLDAIVDTFFDLERTLSCRWERDRAEVVHRVVGQTMDSVGRVWGGTWPGWSFLILLCEERQLGMLRLFGSASRKTRHPRSDHRHRGHRPPLYLRSLLHEALLTPPDTPKAPAATRRTPTDTSPTPSKTPPTRAETPPTPEAAPQTPGDAPPTPAETPSTHAKSPPTYAVKPPTPTATPPTPVATLPASVDTPPTPAATPQTPANAPQTPAERPAIPVATRQTPAATPWSVPSKVVWKTP